jgi:hypothetical protein
VFEVKYVFTRDREQSKEFATAGGAVRTGADKVFGPHLTYRVHLEGNEGRERGFLDARKRAKDLLDSKPLGTVVFLDAFRSGQRVDRVRFRKVQDQPPVADTRGPAGLDRVEGYIRASFPKARFAGDCVCKPNSDHADCAAVDYFDTAENMARMRDFLLANAEYFQIKYVILFDRIWFSDGSSRAYTGTYHSHIHVSVTGGFYRSAC